MSESISIKKLMRMDMRENLQRLNDAAILNNSNKIARKVINHPSFMVSKTVCIYLSMHKEVQTWDILKSAFEMKKRVLVPKVIGKQSNDLILLEVNSIEQIKDFPKNNWGIPEPPSGDDESLSGIIDTIIVPGVAFDNKCNRLGHGKGYYDCCIERVSKSNLDSGKHLPILIGVAFDEQILDCIPTEAHDKQLDFIVTPNEEYCS